MWCIDKVENLVHCTCAMHDRLVQGLRVHIGCTCRLCRLTLWGEYCSFSQHSTPTQVLSLLSWGVFSVTSINARGVFSVTFINARDVFFVTFINAWGCFLFHFYQCPGVFSVTSINAWGVFSVTFSNAWGVFSVTLVSQKPSELPHYSGTRRVAGTSLDALL